MTRWTDYAACRRHDPELFFPVSEVGTGARQVRAAKAVCAGCPVRDACLDHALRTLPSDGIWGGTTPDERAALITAEPGA